MFLAISLLFALICLLPASAKLAGVPAMKESAAHFQIPWRRYQLIGVAELAAAIGVLAGLWLAGLGVAAAIGMTALIIGALTFHRRARDSAQKMAPALVTLVITVAYLVITLAG